MCRIEQVCFKTMTKGQQKRAKVTLFELRKTVPNGMPSNWLGNVGDKW